MLRGIENRNLPSKIFFLPTGPWLPGVWKSQNPFITKKNETFPMVVFDSSNEALITTQKTKLFTIYRSPTKIQKNPKNLPFFKKGPFWTVFS